MAFWGVEVKPGKPIVHSCENPRGRLRVSQATLGIGDSVSKSIVQCNVGRRSPILLCVLLPNKTESCHLDLEFEESDDVIFSALGPRSVYLTGYYVSQRKESSPHSDTESYGVDIENTNSEGSTYSSDNDNYDDSFIDDDDEMQFSPSSPLSSRKDIDETTPEKFKLKKKNRKGRLKKKFIVESNDDASPCEKRAAKNNSDSDGVDAYSLSIFKKKTSIDGGDKSKNIDVPQLKNIGVRHQKSKEKVDHVDICDNPEREKHHLLSVEMTQMENGLPKELEIVDEIAVSRKATVSNDEFPGDQIEINVSDQKLEKNPSLVGEMMKNGLPIELEIVDVNKKAAISNDEVPGDKVEANMIDQNPNPEKMKIGLPMEVDIVDEFTINKKATMSNDEVHGNMVEESKENVDDVDINDKPEREKTPSLNVEMTYVENGLSEEVDVVDEITINKKAIEMVEVNMNDENLEKPKQKRKRKASCKEEKTCDVEIDQKPSVHREDKEHEVEASRNMENVGDCKKSKNRRKEIQLEGENREDIGTGFSDVTRDDKLEQDSLHTDSVMNDQEHLTKDKVVINSELLADGDQSDKKVKKKKKKNKKNQCDRDSNMASGNMIDNQEKTSTEILNQTAKAESTQRRTLSNGLVIEELANGPTDGKVAAPGKRVKIYYTGMLKESGQIFDSNVGKAACRFRLGDEEVLDGWNIGIDGMHVGDKRRLIIPPFIGAAKKGTRENAPPDSWLVYEVELANVHG